MQEQQKNFIAREGKLIVSVFLAGTGVIVWAYNIFLSPVKDIQKEVAVINERINNIQNNHLVHIQDSMNQITKVQEQQASELSKWKEATIKIMTLIEKKL